MVKLSGISNIIAMTYTDRMIVKRFTSSLNDDGTTNVSESPIPVYEDVPCRLSFTQVDNPESERDDSNPTYLRTQVFCDVSIEVLKGDTLIIHRMQDDGTVLETYEGTANKPYLYPSHQQIQFVQTGDA